MINAKMVKILGLVATAVGMGATLLTDWVNEKKMEEKIDKPYEKLGGNGSAKRIMTEVNKLPIRKSTYQPEEVTDHE